MNDNLEDENNRELTAIKGNTIQEAIIEAKYIATMDKTVVSFKFNGIEVRVNKDTPADLIFRDWNNAWDMERTHAGPTCAKEYSTKTIKMIERNKIKRRINWAKRIIVQQQQEILELEEKLMTL